MSFASSVLSNSAKLLSRVNEKVYEIARELFSLTVQLTPSPSRPGPYAIGHLVNQWYPENGADFSEELSSATNPSGADSQARIKNLKGTAFLGKDGKITLANNVSYAYRAEALGWPVSDGWSGRIGPYLMVYKALQATAARHK